MRAEKKSFPKKVEKFYSLTHTHMGEKCFGELCANNNYLDYNKEPTFGLFNLLLSVLLAVVKGLSRKPVNIHNYIHTCTLFAGITDIIQRSYRIVGHKSH